MIVPKKCQNLQEVNSECQEISQATDILGNFFKPLDTPLKLVIFVGVIISESGGQLECDISDLQIGNRIIGETAGISAGAKKKRVQRLRNNLDEWQKRRGITLIEFSNGGQDSEKNNYPTRYRLHLLEVAAGALKAARTSSLFHQNPSQALADAAKKSLHKLPGYCPPIERFYRPRQDDASLLNRQNQTILALVKKNIEIVKRNGGDASQYTESLVRSIFFTGMETSTPEQRNSVDENVPPIETEEHGAPPLNDALEMIDAFASAGATAFDITFLSNDGQNRGFLSAQPVAELKKMLPALLTRSNSQKESLIIRPHSDNSRQFIQLDDLDEVWRARVAEFAFLIIETSSSNFQCWLITLGIDESLARGIKKAVGADPNASGATRLAGTRNFKPKYAPAYPQVSVVAINPGRVVTVEELARAGLIANIAVEKKRPSVSHSKINSPVVMPDYARCVAEAPRARNHEGADRSAADFSFSLRAADRYAQRGEMPDIGTITAELLNASEKAQEKGEKYARQTAKRAAEIVSRNH